MFCLASIHHFRILAPAAYIFFASALPVVAFGEQLSRETGHSLRPFLISDVFMKQCHWVRVCFMLRRELEHWWDASVHRHLWSDPLDFWGAAVANPRRCRAHHNHVLVFVQFRQEQYRRRALFSLGRVVRIHQSFQNLACLICWCFCLFLWLGCVCGLHCCFSFLLYSTFARSLLVSRGWLGSSLACSYLCFSCKRLSRYTTFPHICRSSVPPPPQILLCL